MGFACLLQVRASIINRSHIFCLPIFFFYSLVMFIPQTALDSSIKRNRLSPLVLLSFFHKLYLMLCPVLIWVLSMLEGLRMKTWTPALAERFKMLFESLVLSNSLTVIPLLPSFPETFNKGKTDFFFLVAICNHGKSWIKSLFKL